jgi:L-asparagine transporter-like permease
LKLAVACFGSTKYTNSRFLICIATGGTYANILNSISDSNFSLLAHCSCAGGVPIGYVFPGGVWRVRTTEAATTAQAAATTDKARELRETETGNVRDVQDPARLRGEAI